MDAFAFGCEFPFTVMAIKLAHEHGCFYGIIFTQVIANEFIAIAVIHKSDKGVLDKAKILFPGLCLVNGDADGYSLNGFRNFVEDDLNVFVISIAFTGEIVGVMVDLSA